MLDEPNKIFRFGLRTDWGLENVLYEKIPQVGNYLLTCEIVRLTAVCRFHTL